MKGKKNRKKIGNPILPLAAKIVAFGHCRSGPYLLRVEPELARPWVNILEKLIIYE